ncbi:MAG TPA: hypothetical protein VHE58_01155 [Burkholderiales bacterium]|nr:hypothetical protein [Burkholderiales bacterium]
MSKRMTGWALMILMATFFAVSALAADDASLSKDLTAVIALHGLPCGQVVSVKRQDDNDYIASCQDGNRYRVYVNSEGRVVAQKQ